MVAYKKFPFLGKSERKSVVEGVGELLFSSRICWLTLPLHAHVLFCQAGESAEWCGWRVPFHSSQAVVTGWNALAARRQNRIVRS